MLGNVGGAFFLRICLRPDPHGAAAGPHGPAHRHPLFRLHRRPGVPPLGLAHSYPAAIVARVLMGAGMASMLMGSLKVFTLSFPARTFSTLARDVHLGRHPRECRRCLTPRVLRIADRLAHDLYRCRSSDDPARNGRFSRARPHVRLHLGPPGPSFPTGSP